MVDSILVKLQNLSVELYYNRALSRVFSCEIYKIFQNSIFTVHPCKATSGNKKLESSEKYLFLKLFQLMNMLLYMLISDGVMSLE